MKFLKVSVLVIVVLGLIVAVAAPIGPLPGFFIGGTESSVPDSWGDTGDVHEIKLQVGEGLLPRVVIIWVVQVDGALYVVGSKQSGWVSMLGNGGPVRMRLGERTYPLQATLVTSNWEPILAAYIGKYEADYPDIVAGFPSLEEAQATTAVFKLQAS